MTKYLMTKSESKTITSIDHQSDQLFWEGGSTVVPDSTDYNIGEQITTTIDKMTNDLHEINDAIYQMNNTWATDPDLLVHGSIVVENDIVVGKGQGITEPLGERVNRIEALLGISQRNIDLEKDYPNLQELGDQMDEAIQDLNESYTNAISSIASKYKQFAEECKVMDKLKSDNGDV